MTGTGKTDMLEVGKLPNMRTLILPDPGMVLIDMDLERADLYAVAWDANCPLLKKRLREEDVHTRHAIDFLGKSGYHERFLMKKLAHAADYLVGLRKACADTGLPESTIRAFLDYWEDKYPEIRSKDPNKLTWHKRVRDTMFRQKYVTNAFGYRRPFYGRMEQSLPEAVAWIAQSTVGLVINKILDAIIHRGPVGARDHSGQPYPRSHAYSSRTIIQPLLQVHDSLTLQCRREDVGAVIAELREIAGTIIVPYPDPLNIPVSFKTSDKSWGEVEEYAISMS